MDSVDQERTEAPCSGVIRLIHARDKDLGGFSVGRVLPYRKQHMVGPWIFFDHMGPATFPPGLGVNVRPHPHINLATVTYLFEGEIFHRDSLGNAQSIHPGDINLMVAGRGITHSERETDEQKQRSRKLNGLQLWMALPEDSEEVEPEFLHHSSSDIPDIDVDGVPVRVMMGEAYGATSPVKTFGATLYVEARLKKGQALVLPPADERGLYVVEGELLIENQTVEARSMAILDTSEVKVVAQTDTTIALVGGAPLGERHIFWNFVSSSKERINKAKADWREGRFPKVPGDEIEFIPLPE